MNILKDSLDVFFSDEGNFKLLNEVICEAPIQPRLIDYFVTQLSKNVPFFFYSESQGVPYALTDVYSDYKLHLKGYHKKYFNMFDKKSKKITISCQGKHLEVSIAKLNTFRWLIKSGILKHIRENMDKYTEDYHNYRKQLHVKHFYM